jgi:hypothetical protein
VTPSHRVPLPLGRLAAVTGVVAVILAALPAPASAGFLDFLFGGHEQPPTRVSAPVSSYAEPPPPPGFPPVTPGSLTAYDSGAGRTVAFCVRLCDGRQFPLGTIGNATPVEACKSMCPASKTKVFFGGELNRAVARDGTRYADLDHAFLYRQQLVANCTCNGKSSSGLAAADAKDDPTLRPGDIVATETGFVTYQGGHGQAAAFTPVAAGSLTTALNGSAIVRSVKREEPPAEDDPGTVVPGRIGQSETAQRTVDLNGQPR